MAAPVVNWLSGASTPSGDEFEFYQMADRALNEYLLDSNPASSNHETIADQLYAWGLTLRNHVFSDDPNWEEASFPLGYTSSPHGSTSEDRESLSQSVEITTRILLFAEDLDIDALQKLLTDVAMAIQSKLMQTHDGTTDFTGTDSAPWPCNYANGGVMSVDVSDVQLEEATETVEGQPNPVGTFYTGRARVVITCVWRHHNSD